MGKLRHRAIPVEVDGETVGSLRKPVGGASFQFRFKRAGVRHDVTLRGVEDQALAITRAREIWRSSETGPLPGPRPKVERPPTLWGAVRRYIEMYRLENRESSYRRLRPTLRHFAKFVGGMGIDPRTITTEQLEEFRNLRARQATKGEANGDLTRMLAFCRWMRDKKLVPITEPLNVRKFAVDRRAKQAPTAVVVQNLLEAAQGHWIADWCELAANLGTRPQELLHVRRCDVDLKKQLLRIEAWEKDGYAWRVKDHENRALALNRAAVQILERLTRGPAPADALLFPAPDGGPWEYHNWRRRAWKVAVPRVIRRLVAPYDLRHYFATQAAAAGWPVKKLSRYLGHCNTLVTERYYVDDRTLCEVGAPPVLTKRAAQG
jgi:integrase